MMLWAFSDADGLASSTTTGGIRCPTNDELGGCLEIFTQDLMAVPAWSLRAAWEHSAKQDDISLPSQRPRTRQ